MMPISRACATARRAFARYPDQFSDFWSIVHGNPKKAFGPASVLAAYFSLLGVQTSVDQQVSIPDGTTLHFYNSCPVALFDMLKRQWRNHVHSELRGRKELQNLPPVCFDTTAKAISRLDSKDAKLVRTYLCGGVPTQIRAKHWADTDDTCPLCGRRDTVAHRVIICSGTARIRELHPELGALPTQTGESAWIPTTIEGMRWITSVAQLDPIFNLEVRTAPVHMHDEIRASFLPGPSGPVPGRQTVSRGELCAIAHALTIAKHVRIVADSQYALNLVDALIRGEPLVGWWHNKPNFDLVCMIHQAIHLWPRTDRTLILVKVKSHLTKIEIDQSGYFALGNDRADYFAKQAASGIASQDLRNWRAYHAHLQKHFEKWPGLLSAIADTLREYCSALSTRGQGALVPVDSMPNLVDLAAECPAVNPYFAWPPDDTWKSMTSWRVTFTKQVLRWIGELKWPLVPDEQPITWAELLISFRMHSGMRLPVAHPRNRHIYLTPGIHRIHALGLRTLAALGPCREEMQHCVGARSKVAGVRLWTSTHFPVSNRGDNFLAAVLCNSTW